MDAATVALYEQRAAAYLAARSATAMVGAEALAAAALPELPLLDAGCGPGIYTAHLGPRPLALDAAGAMVRLATASSHALGVRGDLAALPLRRGCLGGAWARQSYLHLRRAELPAALADLHRALAPDAPISLTLVVGPGDGWAPPDDDFPGRFFAGWQVDDLLDVVVGAGFGAIEVEADEVKIWVRARRARTLPDTVGPGMRVLMCGLNPSLHAADGGAGYIGPGNRFWPAVAAAGLYDGAPDGRAALAAGIGMTDLVKRATPRAAELDTSEYREGAERVARLVSWLHPGAVCFVGLSGYRRAIARSARTGWQDEGLGDVPTYVMPSTSGLNAATPYAELVGHVRAVAEATR